jgi:hypothetical protein
MLVSLHGVCHQAVIEIWQEFGGLSASDACCGRICDLQDRSV